MAGAWLAETLAALRPPDALARAVPARAKAAASVPGDRRRWLYLLAELGLGACLADDMGLGKTIQVLALSSS